MHAADNPLLFDVRATSDPIQIICTLINQFAQPSRAADFCAFMENVHLLRNAVQVGDLPCIQQILDHHSEWLVGILILFRAH